jgi:hypothetical protein
LTIRELIKISKKEIAGKMRLDILSRFYGSPVFRQKKSKITREELGTIQQNLYKALYPVLKNPETDLS